MMSDFKILLFILLGWTLITTSCSNDASNIDACSESPANGTINGKAFNFLDGRATDISGILEIRLFSDDVTIDDICSFRSGFGEDAISIFFSLPSAVVGRTDLSLSPNLGDGITTTLFDAEDFSNIISSEGYIEITEVTETTISGYLKAEAGEDGSVCGTFDLTRC